MFFLEKLSHLNTNSRPVESSHTKNHRVERYEDVNRQAHSQDEVARLLIFTISWVVLEFVVFKLLILEISLVLVEPDKCDEACADEE